jgi:hypothetical protein
VSHPGPWAARAARGTWSGAWIREESGPVSDLGGRRRAPKSRHGGAGGAWKRIRFPMAFPVGVTPFGAFPSTEAVPRHPSRLAARRSPFLLRRTEEVPGHGALVDLLVRVTAAAALSPLIAVVSLPSFDPARGSKRAGCRHGLPDHRALVRCEVRCVQPAFPPGGRPMLPWALPIEGSLMLLGSRRSLALPGCRSSRTRGTEAPRAGLRWMRSPAPGRSPSGWRASLNGRFLHPDRPPSRDLPAASRWETADPTCASSRRSVDPRGAT